MIPALLTKCAPNWLLWLLFLAVPLNLFAYFNLEVSYKYQVDIAQTMVEISPPSATSKTEAFTRIAQRGQEIRWAQRRSLLYAALAAVAASGLGLRNSRLNTIPKSTTN
ncbi:hypothetical protein [Hymenobacter sp. UYP22]|uniref:hypothetical protein n=1 Tax=Hymenobacter sp. UYP22 TaxID=3156348 RepID=UPI003399ADCE